MKILLPVVLTLVFAGILHAEEAPETDAPTADHLGELRWARAVAENGTVTPDPDKPGVVRFHFEKGKGLKRSNLTLPDTARALTIQPRYLHLDTPGAHNAKLMIGYMDNGWQFSHGDNNDLAHWANRDRVVLFIPLRHAFRADPKKQANYFISPYEAQTISVVQFKAGDLIKYEWYANRKKPNENILMDLAPFAAYDNDLMPGVNHPIFRFDVFPGGGWRVMIEHDGTDGLAGGEDPEGYDLIFTHESQGAKPYSLDLDWPNACSVSVYCPSGDDTGATIDLQIEAYDRKTEKPAGPLKWEPVKQDVKIEAETTISR